MPFGEALSKFIHDFLSAKYFSCKTCSEVSESKVRLGKSIVLDTQIFFDINNIKELSFAELPEKLNFDNEYILAGAVGYVPNHFIGFCRSASGTWAKCDDMLHKKEQINPKTTSARIHMLVYVVTG